MNGILIQANAVNTNFVDIGATIYPRKTLRIDVLGDTFNFVTVNGAQKVLPENILFTDVIKNTGVRCTGQADFLAYVLPIL